MFGQACAGYVRRGQFLPVVSATTSLAQTLPGAVEPQRGAGAVPRRSTCRSPFTGKRKLDGLGVYLRTDFWAPITSGGSYGHTCYVAKELAARDRRGSCACCAHRYKLLDDFGVRQVVMDAPTTVLNEDAMVNASHRLLPDRQSCCEVLQAGLHLRAAVPGQLRRGAAEPRTADPVHRRVQRLGDLDAAQLRGDRYRFYEDLYLKAEEPRSVRRRSISVVSEHVKDDLLARGVDARKDPGQSERRGPRQLRAARRRGEAASCARELGFTDDDRVIGFTGTFGGWHGIDVLAAAHPADLRGGEPTRDS